MASYQFYRGIVLNPQTDQKCDFWDDGLLVVKNKHVHDLGDYRKMANKYLKHFTKSNTTELKHTVIMPGFFDMHFHWVQDDVRLMAKDSLLTWLLQYTFPAEEKFALKTHAEKKAKFFFKRLLKTGTVGGACYSSVHEHALKAAMKEAQGDLVIGNVLMTINSPEKLKQKPSEAQSLVSKMIKKYGDRYILTPRFALATDMKTMQVTSEKADWKKIFKQSHLAETKQEIQTVLKLYQKDFGYKKLKTYTDIYHHAGMLGKRSLMGHAIHLSPSELKLLSKTKTNLIHCPTSNAPHKELGLGSGLFDFKKIEKAKISWALGSDIGGGPYLSMFDVIHSFVTQNQKKKRKEATYTKGLYHGTLAGAKILDVGKKAGNLDKKKKANFILVKIPQSTKKFQSAEEVLKHLCTQTKKRSDFDSVVMATYLNGVKVS